MYLCDGEIVILGSEGIAALTLINNVRFGPGTSY